MPYPTGTLSLPLVAANVLVPVGLLLAATATAAAQQTTVSAETTGSLPWIEIDERGRGFRQAGSGDTFVPWGFNYDHDRQGQLLEDYWMDHWDVVVEDFEEMKRLGANLVRIHLQFGRFMDSPTQPNVQALDQLARLIRLAEQLELYLDVTGLGCYHKNDVPGWYDALDEQQRWAAQGRFWEAVAQCGAGSPAIFCYDLMNEPVIPGGARRRDDWLGPAFAGKHFVQFVTLETKGRPRHQIARNWIHTLRQAIRQHDQRHFITVGLVPWSLDRPGLTSGFVPDKIADQLDLIAVHLYPETGKLDEARATLRGFQVGKPVLIEEMFPLKCSPEELAQFVSASDELADGWVSFYWGKTPEEYRGQQDLTSVITADWLERFQQLRVGR